MVGDSAQAARDGVVADRWPVATGTHTALGDHIGHPRVGTNSDQLGGTETEVGAGSLAMQPR